MRLALPATLLVSLSASAFAQAPLLKLTGNSVDARYGWMVKALGDLDGDGFPDFAVGSDQDGTVAPQAGRVALFSGRDGALIREHFGDAQDDRFGWRVSAAGDFDGDGVDDYLVGAPQTHDWSSEGFGYVRLYSGATGKKLQEYVGGELDAGFSDPVEAVGDVDGDGTTDIFIGAPFAGTGALDFAGAAYLYSGATGAVIWKTAGTHAEDFVGYSAAPLGDVDHDGCADFVYGNYGTKDALGRQRGELVAISGKSLKTLWSVLGSVEDDLGWTVVAVGDTDGDGTDDVIAGMAKQATVGGGIGEAKIYSGYDGTVLACFSATQNETYFGYAVDRAGDVDGDGLPDVLVAEPRFAVGQDFFGITHVFSGRTGAWLADVASGIAGDDFSATVQHLGDVDFDGTDDFLVGAPHCDFDEPNQAGTVYLVSLHAELAAATNYGAGWPGTLGVPALTATTPELGATVTLDVGNSRGVATVGTLFLGFGRSNTPTSAGGTFLVAPPLAPFPLALPAGGLQLSSTLPNDVLLAGFVLDLQALELDPGASHGLSFTAGLELRLGGAW